jgi:phosphomethylpyrimidine synthase
VIASKIAAHAADVARGWNNSADRDKKLSAARANLDWETHLSLSLDPKTARQMHEQASDNAQVPGLAKADYCSMCGKQWCSVRTNREVREMIAKDDTPASE